MRRQIVSGFLLLLAMFLMGLAAHDGYVKRINQQQYQLIQQLQQGQYHLSWALHKPADLVNAFGHGWQLQQNGILLDGESAAVSLAFNEQLLLPTLHQQLSFNWQSTGTGKMPTKLLLEFSRVDLGEYYYSPTIEVKNGANHINLAPLVWSIKPERFSFTDSWQAFPVFNTLVLRFSNKQQPAISGLLSNLEIKQTRALHISQSKQMLSAPFNNQLRHQWQNERFEVTQSPVMQAYFNASPMWLFGWSLLSLLLSVVFYPGQVQVGKDHQSVHKKTAYMIIGLVAMVAWALQIGLVVALIESQSWLVIALFALPSIWLFKRWSKPKNKALMVWSVTFFAALIMLFSDGFKLNFLRDLPLYLLWALCQQVILGPLVSDYLRDKTGFAVGYIAILTGSLFAILHLPNQVLMLATFIGGIAWSYSWLRYHNIYANAISHALLALLFYQTMPQSWLGTARIGLWF